MKPYERVEVPNWLERKIGLAEQLRVAKEEISNYDYIGIKIAMGVATSEDYSEEIAYTESIRQVIRELEEELEKE